MVSSLLLIDYRVDEDRLPAELTRIQVCCGKNLRNSGTPMKKLMQKPTKVGVFYIVFKERNVSMRARIGLLLIFDVKAKMYT